MANFLHTIETAVVETWNQDGSTLFGLCGKIEVGTIDSLREKQIQGNEMPYVGVKAMDFGPDSEEQSGVLRMPVRVVCEVAHVAALQSEAEEKVREILAELAIACGTEKRGGRFGIGTDGDSAIQDVMIGRGELLEALADQEETTFMVIGQFEFSVDWMQVVED